MNIPNDLPSSNPDAIHNNDTCISAQFDVIHAWSGPRSLSTSLMYSFAQRDDTEVVDEPFYAHYLRATGAKRPYRDELLAKMETDGDKVFRNVIMGPCKKRFRYCKVCRFTASAVGNRGIALHGLTRIKECSLLSSPISIEAIRGPNVDILGKFIT